MEESKSNAVDVRYGVSVSADAMTASLTVSLPGNGGAIPDQVKAREALKRAGVVFGIDEQAIANAIASTLGGQTEVAHGAPPRQATDAWLEPLIAVNQQRHADADEVAKVDFRDRGMTPSVNPGDELMRRHPPVEGASGHTVTGKELRVAVAKNVKFGVRLEGVAVDPAEPDLLRAAVTGQPILTNEGISVEPVLRLEAIDIASGNIEFVGSVEVRGDVQSGMRVKAGGDITVGGTVESAELIAGGDITVKGGVIGHAPQEHKDAEQLVTARLTAKGSIRAHYLENCIALAEQNVVVDDMMIQCDVTAIDHVIVGQSVGKGSIVGGFVRATSRVSAGILGAAGSSETHVFVGVNPLLQKSLDEHRQHLDAKLKENGDLTKVLKLLEARPDKREIADKARMTLKKVNEEIAELMNEEHALKHQLQVADKAKIVVTGCIYGGVTVAISKKSHFVKEDVGPGVFVIAKETLIYGDLAAYGG